MHDKLTKKDIELMEAELNERRLHIRPKIIAEVQRCREYGDLSENYEYKAAKEEQRRNDSRMRYLEAMIKTARVIDEDAGEADAVKLYDRVTVYVPEDEEEMIVQVVSTVRTDPEAGLVSLESPLGKAILGKRVGQTVEIRVSDDYSYEAEIRAIVPAEDDGSAPLLPF